MDYIGILKKAYQITIKNKFLWIFGVLIAGAGGIASFNPGFNYPTSSKDTDQWGATLTSAQFEQKLAEFWANYGNMMIIGAAILLLVCLMFFILSIISQGALIGSVNRIDKGEKADFKTGFSIGWRNFWRVWGVAIIYLLFILASLCLLIIPVSLLVISQSYALAIVWGLLMFFVCLAFWILISLIAPYSTIVAVLEKLSVWESIRESLHLFRQNWVEIILIYLLLVAITIAYGIVILLLSLIIGGIMLAIGVAFWLASMWTAIIYGFMVGLAFIICLIIINGAFKSFASAVLTLTYNRLKKTA